jgi:hypothetical protein
MRIETRYFLRFIVATVLGIGAVVAWRWLPRPLPPEECSELYRAYMDTPGVDATFIRGFQVNDTVTVDVTLLQATDSAGWERLITDFKIVREFLTGNDNNIMVRKAKKGCTGKQIDPVPENNDLILLADGMHTISIFHITDKDQFYSIPNKHINGLKK